MLTCSCLSAAVLTHQVGDHTVQEVARVGDTATLRALARLRVPLRKAGPTLERVG